MPTYRRNKIKTAWQIFRRIRNWPTAFHMRLKPGCPGLRLLNFRDGLNLLCRGNTRDWDVAHELLFAGGYSRAMQHLNSCSGTPIVLDLGGNIGLFSLLAARTHPTAQIFAYEPGPPNYRLFEMNRLANPSSADRIQLTREAVGGNTRTTRWFFDTANPGGSSLFGKTGEGFDVQIRAFAEIVHSMPDAIALAKIDIEGAEYELLDETPADVWQRVNSVSLELHDDPRGLRSRTDFLNQLKRLGFHIEEEAVCSFFLHR